MSSDDSEDQRDAFDGLLGALRLDGHILGSQFPTLVSPERYEAFVLLPAADALADENQNSFVVDGMNKLITVGGQVRPEVTIIGEDYSEPNACVCPTRTSLILFTHYLSLQSPVKCGQCFLPVPLYRLPRFSSGEFVEVIAWADDYKACDLLFMNSATGEQFAARQLSRSDSSLSVRGLDLCACLSKMTGAAVYYHLNQHYGRSKTTELSRLCPKCRSEWRLTQPWHRLFDFRCDHCKLLSNIAWSIRS